MAIEDGILLLCSDGLSDRHVVENSWQEYAHNILHTGIPLTEAVQSWLALAHQANGDDNISLLLMSCRVTPPTTERHQSSQLVAIDSAEPDSADLEPEPSSKFKFSKLVTRLLLLVTILGLLVSGAIAVSVLRPNLLPGQNQIDRQK
jgi:protein phosphatase